MKTLFIGLLLACSNLAWAEDLRFLKADSDALQARVDLIQQAKEELLVEYFSVWNDEQSIGGMALLIDAVKRGVKVKIIMDAMSHTVPKQTMAALLDLANGTEKGKNLELKVYNPLSINIFKVSHRDHSKMLIADGKYLITGGRNVGDKYFGISKKRNFSDLDIFAKGTLAQDARENFLATWNSPVVEDSPLGAYTPFMLSDKSCKYAAPKVKQECEANRLARVKAFENEKTRLEAVRKHIKATANEGLFMSDSGLDWFVEPYSITDVKFMSHGTDKLVSKKTAHLNADLLGAIAKAEFDVNIVSPYLMPTERLLGVFDGLLKKKVRIRIITNSMRSTDNLMAQAGYRTMKKKLIGMGIEIYEYNGPDTIHAKTAVLDERVILIGTYNIDPRSAFINREIGVMVDDRENTGMARELGEVIDEFRATATLVGINGAVVNKSDLKDVSAGKKILLKMVTILVPLIKSQL